MNIQLANVISDLIGVTGQMIVRAIVGGERDAQKLVELSHPRIQVSRGEIWAVSPAPNTYPKARLTLRNGFCSLARAQSSSLTGDRHDAN